jgi:peptide deformylase
MALRDLVLYPQPLLHEVSKEVTTFDSELFSLLEDMADTMYASRGIGLAAPQIGVLQRVAVIDVSREENDLLELINPTIVAASGDTSSEEGCLSIPEYRDVVKRHSKITLHAYDRHGRPFEMQAEGLLAICAQHEIDHLDGILFVDRLSRLKRELFKRWYRKTTES